LPTNHHIWPISIFPLELSSLSIEQACGRGTPHHIIITTG